MASQLQEFINIGQQMNLSGDELMKFAREMVADAKVQRLEDRRLEAEKRETEAKFEVEKREVEAKLETEKIKLEIERRGTEIKQLELQARLEAEKVKLKKVKLKLS